MDMLNELTRRKKEVLNSAGKPKGNGVMSARERINALLDAGSFIELSMFEGLTSEKPAQAVVTGYGTVEDRVVYVYAQSGGADAVMDAQNAKKIVKCMEMARTTGAVCVGLVDGLALPLEDGLTALSAFGEIFAKSAECKGTIMQIVAVLGAAAGGAVFAPAMADFVFMTEKTSRIYTEGAQTIEGMTPDSTFGDAAQHAKDTGLCSVVAKDDADCMAKLRMMLSMLPSNNVDGAAPVVCSDDLNRLAPALSGENVAARDIIASVFDEGSVLEISENYAPNMVTALCRMNGRTVAAVASTGTLCARMCEKAARFVSFADSFNIPVVTFADVDGYKSGALDVIRAAGGLFAAYAKAAVAKVTVVTGDAYSSAALCLGSKAAGADVVLAFANAHIAAATPEVGATILYADQVKKSKNPVIERDIVTKKYIENDANVFEAARVGAVDDVIDPAQARPRIASALEMLFSKKR